MFNQTFVSTGGTRRDRTIAGALLIQAVGVLALTLLPLLSVAPISADKRFTIVPAAEPLRQAGQERHAEPPAQPAPSVPAFRLTSLPPLRHAGPHSGPLAPDDVPAISGTGEMASAVAIPGAGPFAVAPPVPKPPLNEVSGNAKAPLRVSSVISQSQLLFGPKPTYPRLAIIARVEGIVRLQAVIGRTGRIENLHALSGSPLLIPAAMEAVRDWRYRPLLLNGEPVEIITEIDVNFALKQ